jgi:hypothetical protein
LMSKHPQNHRPIEADYMQGRSNDPLPGYRCERSTGFKFCPRSRWQEASGYRSRQYRSHDLGKPSNTSRWKLTEPGLVERLIVLTIRCFPSLRSAGNVDACETNPALAGKINADLPGDNCTRAGDIHCLNPYFHRCSF